MLKFCCVFVVLPSFEVTLNPRKPFFYVNEHSLGVDISAKYDTFLFNCFTVHTTT